MGKEYSNDCPEFFREPYLYELWENRFEDKPVTTRELYRILEKVALAIDRAKFDATFAGYNVQH